MDVVDGYVEAFAINGHRMVYAVIGTDKDGEPKLSQWDARHSDNCPCYESEDGDWL